jgi:glutathione S-transferase
LAKLPCVTALHKSMAERPRLKAYLASERRVSFKETGIFRRYPELDG